MSTSSVRGKNQRGDQQKQQHQSSHRDNKMSTVSYLDSSRDPQSNDAARVQSSFLYESLAIVLTKLENFLDTASTSWCQHITYVSAQQVLFCICNSGSHYYENIKILLKIASGRRF